MRNFLKNVISRHTQPEGNIIPRIRGRYEPEAIPPSHLAGETTHTPRIDTPVRRPDDPLAFRSIPEPSEHQESAVPSRDETNEDNIPRNATPPQHFLDPQPPADHKQFTDPVNCTRPEQLKDPGFFERSTPFREARRAADPEDQSRDPRSGDPRSNDPRPADPERPAEPWLSVDPGTLRDRSWKASDDMTLQPPGIPVKGTKRMNEDERLSESHVEKEMYFSNNLPGENMDAYRSKVPDKFLLPENRSRMEMVLPATGGHEAGRNADESRLAMRNPAGEPPSPGQQIRSEPVIRVSIGRIEVKAVHPVQPPPPARKEAPKPRLSLDDFLNQRKRS
jgi:hypothetical protein